MYFRDKLSLYQIAKRTGLSSNAMRKWVRAPEATQLAYQRCASINKLRPFHDTLEQALKADSFRQSTTAEAPKHFSSRSRLRVMTAATVSSRIALVARRNA